MPNTVNFKDLETKGFLVIPNFLDASILTQIKEHYSKQQEKFKSRLIKNNNYNIITVDEQFIPEDQLHKLLQKITQETNIVVNLIKPITTYFDNQIVEFGWHQDHEPYYMWQDSYNAVNCWIPIVKPNPTQSGISVIPQNSLAQHCPDIFESSILGKGAKMLNVQSNGTTLMRDDSEGSSTVLPFNINDIAESLILNEGDLLILRQDLFHKTQDLVDSRVAISIRCVNANTVLTRDKFINGCERKHNMIKNNQSGFAKLKQKFINENLETILLRDL